jgi:hypothetical protein
MTRWIASVVVVAVVGCTKEGEQATDRTVDAKEPAALRVEVGDCAGGGVSFVSGPSPVVEGGAFASLTGAADFSSGLDDRDVYGGLLGNEVGEMQGGFGFGRSGTGPGGGGTGWGTIGTGRYGTIGHGSGTGSGNMRGRSASVPQVAIGNASATGDLDKNIIRRYIRRKLPQVRYCYEKQLLLKPSLAGKVDVQFVIDAAGTVSSASATGMDPEVSSCIGGAIKSIQFPRPKGGGVVKVTYPFSFRPAGETASAPAQPTPDPVEGKKERREEGQYRMKSNEADPELARKQALDQAREAGILGMLAQAEPPAPPYRPGADSPLRGHEPMLATCLRKQPAAHGVLVIELDIDGAGAIKGTKVHGVAGEFPACLAAAVAQLRVPVDSAGVQRCPVAFGSMPPGEARGVDITTTAVTVDGKQVADAAAIVSDGGRANKIDPLYELVQARTDQSAAPVVAVRGPIALRATDDASMKVVTRALLTLAMADSDFFLAAQQGAGWRSLKAIDLPMVPVALDPGGAPIQRWLGGSPPAATASMLVSKDKVWIGATGSAAEAVTVAAGPDQPARLEQALRALKQSPAFASSRDLEIAGEDDATYKQLVAAVDAASRAGFADWIVLAPDGLSAAPPP